MNKHLTDYRSNIIDGNYITIDPGARLGGGTGVAVFENFKLSYSKLCSSNMGSYDERVEGILNIIYNDLAVFKYYNNFSIFIERPIFFDSHKGLVAAKSNSLFKLTYFYGRLFQLCTALSHISVYHLEINHWKGQLSKKQVAVRVAINVQVANLSGDEIDAIGMGLYLNGSFQ